MSVVKKVVDIRVASASKQLGNVLGFVKEPKGVFETVDSIVKTFRGANRETLEAIGLRLPFTQRAAGRVLERLRLPILRRR
jgi:hypothetical protein